MGKMNLRFVVLLVVMLSLYLAIAPVAMASSQGIGPMIKDEAGQSQTEEENAIPGHIVIGGQDNQEPAEPAKSAPKPKPAGETPSPPPAQQPALPAEPPAVGEVLPAVNATGLAPNESGKVMLHMFHNFVDADGGKDRKNTMTFTAFRAYLEKLYNNHYRPVSMGEYVENRIDLPAGYIPFVLTFDDGWASQFSLVEENGVLVASPHSAVGVLMDFQRTHPDFNLRGIFYVNLSRGNTFGSVGTLADRIAVLTGLGFEVGNHSYDHADFSKLSVEETTLQMGKNQMVYSAATGGQAMSAFSLPYGSKAANPDNIVSGSFEGVAYHTTSVVLAGANPAPSPASADFNPYRIARVLAPGMDPLHMDGNWWVDNIGVSENYVSDGDPNTITVPGASQHLLSGQIPREQIVILP